MHDFCAKVFRVDFKLHNMSMGHGFSMPVFNQCQALGGCLLVLSSYYG